MSLLPWSWIAVSGALSLLVGCQGSLDGAVDPAAAPSGSGGGGPAATQPSGGSSAACQALPDRRIRRLARREYANVVSDLLGASAGEAVVAALPADPRVHGF